MLSIIIMLGTFFIILSLGYFIISKVPPLLHTPLMSATNAISSITILGAFILLSKNLSTGILILVMIAIITASFNCIGGFMLTDRMFNMFKRKR